MHVNAAFFKKAGLVFWLVILVSAALFAQDYTPEDAPDALSRSHTQSPGLKNCMKCHTPELEIDASKCLACHREIAVRIEQQRGFHREFTEGCSDCHVEHGGADSKLVDLDPEDFDHAETGADLKGVHTGIKDCRACHRPDNTLPRNHSQSYLFTRRGCQACHEVPHPGRQEQCLACHSQQSWRVGIWRRGER